MRRLVIGMIVTTVVASTQAATTPLRQVQTRSVAGAGTLPIDLTSPEGKTRWHLDSLALLGAATVTISREDQTLVEETRKAGAAAAGRVVFSGTDAERWLMPDHDAAQMKMGARVELQFSETRDGLVDRIVAEVATVGIGWLHLPGEPQEVVLQRVLVLRQRAGERALRPESLVHRWVSPREGVVTTMSGPASADGKTRLSIGSIDIVERVLSGAATLKLYADQIYRGHYVDLKYGFDARGSAVNPFPVSSLVPDSGVNNICDLVNLNTWNFSGITSGQQTATTEAPSNPAETCNSTRCGYSGYPAGGSMGVPILERLDRNLTGTIRKDNQIVQREDRATDVTFWLRAGTQNEGVSGPLGTGETHFCFTDEATKPKNEVPAWQMTHNDAGGWYTQAGDTWTSTPIVSPACLEEFNTAVCSGSQTTVYSRGGCTAGGRALAGAQFGKVVKGGVVVLPSGHTVNALVLRNTTEFCNYLLSNCSFLVSTVRTIVYIWQAPFIGSVALLRGPLEADFAAGEAGETPCTNFTTVEFTDIAYGLLPPISITAGSTTDTSVNLSWNPGNDAHRLVGYKIYWDTDPGASTNYAFNSVTNAGQVAFVGTSATISGLTPGTTYYFTVTSLSDFTDPSSGIVTRYESIRYPTTVSGDPNFAYPAEVAASTTGGSCVPTQALSITVGKALPNIQVCWQATNDPCAVGYDVLTSSSPAGGFGVVGQVGLTSCWVGDPPPPGNLIFIQAQVRGTGGNGP